MTGLETIGGALTALKALTGIAKDINNIEFNQKIIELQQDLLEIQENSQSYRIKISIFGKKIAT